VIDIFDKENIDKAIAVGHDWRVSFQLSASNLAHRLQGFASYLAYSKLPSGSTGSVRLLWRWIRPPSIQLRGSHHPVRTDREGGRIQCPSVHAVLHRARRACADGEERTLTRMM
jgi:hypothetical protein